MLCVPLHMEQYVFLLGRLVGSSSAPLNVRVAHQSLAPVAHEADHLLESGSTAERRQQLLPRERRVGPGGQRGLGEVPLWQPLCRGCVPRAAAGQAAQPWHRGGRGSCRHLRRRGLAASGLFFVLRTEKTKAGVNI